MSRRVRFSPLVAAGVFAGLGFVGPSVAAAGDVPLVAQPPISSSVFNATSVSTADVDGDGDLDALSASRYGDRVLWHENAGNGSPWAEHLVGAGIDGANFVSGADVDADGDTDLFVTAWFAGTVLLFENTAGNGSAWTLRTMAAGVAGAESVVPADVDRDGDVDAFTASRFNDTVAWYENVGGTGTAWAQHLIDTAANGAESVFAADVDRDGDLDVFSASSVDDSVSWHENLLGNGRAWSRHVITTLANGADLVVAADFDGDGDLDALSSSFFDSKVAWYENLDGAGGSWATFTIAIGPAGPESVAAADLDGDGDVDALASTDNSDRITWYDNVAGDGSVWTPRIVSTLADRAFSVWAADVDGDGDSDVLGGTLTRVEYFRNEAIHSGACFVTPPPISTSANAAVGAFAGDLDRDGDTDAVSASLDGTVAWYDNAAGNGAAWTRRTITTAAPGAYSAAGADVDGDGDVDLLSASGGDNKIAWYRNNGNGSAWTTHTIATNALGATGVFATDVDGDGDQDAVSASSGDDKVAWYENTAGDGSAWTLRTISTTADGAHAVHVADVDGDGDVDVLSSSFFDNKVAWYENTAGNGSAWTVRTIATNAAGTLAVFAVDLDRDGDQDVLATWSGASTVAWYENTGGNGSAWAAHVISRTALGPNSVSAVDMDRDGDVDAVSASLLDGKVAWYENLDGQGLGWTLHTLTTSKAGANEVLAADVDGDGDADVLCASGNDGTLAWYDDRGGQFSLAVTDTAPQTAGNGELAAMLRIDATHLGRSGDHDLELATMGLLFEQAAGDPLTTSEANALVASLRIYRDANGNGVFDLSDALVVTVADLALSNGIQVVAFTNQDPNVQVAFGSPRTYFVVVEVTPDGNQQRPHHLRVTHLGVGPQASSAEDRAFGIPLRPACPVDVSSSIKEIVPVELMGFSIE